MNDSKDFIITCKKCNSTSTEISPNGGGCDSCGYGSSVMISCNECHNCESVS